MLFFTLILTPVTFDLLSGRIRSQVFSLAAPISRTHGSGTMFTASCPSGPSVWPTGRMRTATKTRPRPTSWSRFCPSPGEESPLGVRCELEPSLCVSQQSVVKMMRGILQCTMRQVCVKDLLVLRNNLRYRTHEFGKEQLPRSLSRWTRWKSLNTAEAPRIRFMQSIIPGPVPLSSGTTSGVTCRWTPPRFFCSSSPR